MTYWYLSFVDPDGRPGHRFLGGCVVAADSMESAIAETWLRGCNPGEEVMGHNIQRFGVNVLLSKDQLRLLDDQ